MMQAASPEAYQLLHDGVIALSVAESNGIRVDVPYVQKTIRKIEKRITRLEGELREDGFYKLWRKTFGSKTNLGSKSQLGHLVFDVLGHPCLARTKPSVKFPEGQPKCDEYAFAGIDLPFLNRYAAVERYKKLTGTFLTGILRETEGEYCHPFFNLHIARTYRSSSDSPNFQNFPARSDEGAAIVRRSFISREGHQLVEVDFKGIEVCVSACYNKDPMLIRYIKDPSKDMHRDMASQIYLLKPEEVSKPIRHCGKNMFVFPEFYGSFYPQCAKPLWDAVDRLNLTTQSGKSLRNHLTRCGITERGACEIGVEPASGTFEHHLQAVERDFWVRRFCVYHDWKHNWFQRYLECGYFETYTGFIFDGILKKNDVTNYPVQGSAFHCLLWCFIQLQKWLIKHDMKTKLVGQIHDSIVADVHEDEMEDYLAYVKWLTTTALARHYKWINVPMGVEAEASPPGASWYEKKPIEL